MVLGDQEQRVIKDAPSSSPRVLFSAEVTGAGHSSGYYTLLRAFREAGMEVVDGGFQTPGTIAHIARDEDVDVVAFRIMDGDPVILVEQLLSALEEVDRSDVALVVGGIIAPTAAVRLRELGVTGVFGPGTPLTTIISHIRNL